MSVPLKLGAFAALLGVVFLAASLAGAAIDPAPRGGEDAPAHGAGAATHGAAPQPIRGLAVSEDGLRLDLATPAVAPGEAAILRFRILDGDGVPVRHFDIEHERRMHLVVVRRDLTGFQHLHPQMAADGTWRVPVHLQHPGSYRVLADFSHERTASTLGADLRVDGAADLRGLPSPATTAPVGDGLRVTLDAPPLRAGREADMRFTVSRDGEPVVPEPYLGARGHLVALREGDLAFLHVHPTADDGAAFATTFPTAGRYRLFLQVKVDGEVRNAPFTVEVPQ
ncbi:MAG: hypothetical protein ACSLFR_12315 [Solirubrobacteraceae bacterium]